MSVSKATHDNRRLAAEVARALRGSRLTRGRAALVFVYAVAILGNVLGLIGRAWNPLVWLLVVTAITGLIAAFRWQDRWAWRWWHLWIWFGRWQNEDLRRRLGVVPPSLGVTLDWLDGRPAGTVPDSVRVGALANAGRFAEARELAAASMAALEHGRLRLELFERACDWKEGERPDFTKSREMVAALPRAAGAQYRAHLAWLELCDAVTAGDPVRRLPLPDTRGMRLSWKDRVSIWRRFMWPAQWFVGLALGTYAVISVMALFFPGR